MRRNPRTERGAAVFIVVMVLTLLTAIGIFAVRSASLVTRASGHARQSAQTLYYAEYATRATVVEVGDIQRSAKYVSVLETSFEPCMVHRDVLVAVAGQQHCYKLLQSEIAQRVGGWVPGRLLLDPPTTVADGSLEPRLGTILTAADTMQGQFAVELHDLRRAAAMAGMNTDDDRGNSLVTLTAFAQLRMVGAGTTGACPVDAALCSASLRAVRATVTVSTL